MYRRPSVALSHAFPPHSLPSLACSSARRSSTVYQPPIESPPMTTSPPRTAPDDMSELMACGTTAAVIGNSTGAVFTTRTTLPEPGVSKKQKKGRSQPSSV